MRAATRSDRGANTRAPAPARSDRGEAVTKGHRRETSDPYRVPEPYEEFSNTRYSSREPTRSVSHGDLDGERRKSMSTRPSKPSSYDTREARRDDLDRSASKSRPQENGRSGGMLNRVLSRASGSSRTEDKGPRVERSASSRLSRYSNRQPTDRRDDNEMELARIEEEEMIIAMQKRRSAANRAAQGYDESDPRWYRDERDTRHSSFSRSRSGAASRDAPSRTKAAQSVGLERSASAVRRSMDRERQRTLEALEKNDRDLPMVSRTDAVVRSRSQSQSKTQPQSQVKTQSQSRARALSGSRSALPPTASREAALAAVTGVSPVPSQPAPSRSTTGTRSNLNVSSKTKMRTVMTARPIAKIPLTMTNCSKMLPSLPTCLTMRRSPLSRHCPCHLCQVCAKRQGCCRASPRHSHNHQKIPETTSDDDEDSDASEGLRTAPSGPRMTCSRPTSLLLRFPLSSLPQDLLCPEPAGNSQLPVDLVVLLLRATCRSLESLRPIQMLLPSLPSPLPHPYRPSPKPEHLPFPKHPSPAAKMTMLRETCKQHPKSHALRPPQPLLP